MNTSTEIKLWPPSGEDKSVMVKLDSLVTATIMSLRQQKIQKIKDLLFFLGCGSDKYENSAADLLNENSKKVIW